MKRITKLGLSFDQEASLYHAIRPRYPEALFDDLIQSTGLRAKAKIVEIGPGTGQATQSLAARGFIITAIEIGKSLAEMARHELQQYPDVTIINDAFENVDLPTQSFDVVFAATSFHWIKPGLQYLKPYHLLKSKGHLAIVHTHHVSDGKGDLFFHASQPIYKKYFPNSNKPNFALPDRHEIKPAKIDDKLFALSHFQTFPLRIEYTAKEYIQLINTYSPTLQLPVEKRAAFLNDIQHLIVEQFEGKLEKYFCMSLTVAQKLCDESMIG
jgi:SAM-dependent methyltransferase